MRIPMHRHAVLQWCALASTLIVVALCASACGDDSPAGPENSGNLPPSAGTGTGTLRVVAEVQGRDSGGGFETEFLATVADTLGNPAAATVVVSGRSGDVTLTEEAPGSYRALRSGYETGSYTLDVTGDDGSVTGVTVVAPDIHSVFVPDAGDTVEADTALNVRWTRAAAAHECRLETRDYDSDWIYGDPGTLWTPGIGNPPRTDQRVRIKRRNVQEPAGGLPGSRFSVRIRRTVEPIVAQ